MTRDLRRRLEAKRAAAVREAAERLLAADGDPGDDPGDESAGDAVKRIDSYGRVLAAMPKSRRREIVSATVVALICLAIVGLGWSLRVPRTDILATLRGDAVALRLREPLAWSGALAVDPRPLRLEQLTALDSPLPEIDGPDGTGWVEIDGGQVTLSSLRLGAAGRLIVERDDDGSLRIYASEADFSGELALLGAALVSTGGQEGATDSHPIELSIPETFVFRAAAGLVPASVQLRPLGDLVVRNIAVSGLSFSRDRSREAGSASFVSTIAGGTLVLADITEKVELRRGEELALDGVDGLVAELRIGETIEVEFRGSAERIRLGPEGFQRDLTPTLLHYYYHKQRLPFFWSVVAFLWGILWSVRKLIFA